MQLRRILPLSLSEQARYRNTLHLPCNYVAGMKQRVFDNYYSSRLAKYVDQHHATIVDLPQHDLVLLWFNKDRSVQRDNFGDVASRAYMLIKFSDDMMVVEFLKSRYFDSSAMTLPEQRHKFMELMELWVTTPNNLINI
jgi:hypothetical protein